MKCIYCGVELEKRGHEVICPLCGVVYDDCELVYGENYLEPLVVYEGYDASKIKHNNVDKLLSEIYLILSDFGLEIYFDFAKKIALKIVRRMGDASKVLPLALAITVFIAKPFRDPSLNQKIRQHWGRLGRTQKKKFFEYMNYLRINFAEYTKNIEKSFVIQVINTQFPEYQKDLSIIMNMYDKCDIPTSPKNKLAGILYYLYKRRNGNKKMHFLNKISVKLNISKPSISRFSKEIEKRIKFANGNMMYRILKNF
ncbi:MAG: hypothetical protein Q6363_004140 [Candidatus Njordarchaeota archaeon]